MITNIMVVFCSAYVTLKSGAIQMFIKYMLLSYAMYCMCAYQMQIKATYLLTYKPLSD